MNDVQLGALTPADREAVEAVFRDDGGYAQRVHGRETTPQDIDDLFSSRPPSVSAERKHTLGLWDGDDLIGVVDLITDFPEPGTNYLGLLQIRQKRQGQGLARTFHDLILGRFPGTSSWRLSVVDTNIEVVGFWERLGYARTGDTRAWSSPSGARHEAITMERRN